MALATVSVVHDLTNDTFRGFVEENDMVLVGFVLPFLPVSQRFSREYQEAARVLHGSGVQFTKVDCVKETEVYKEFEFSRWPTVKFFRGFDNVKQYEGAWKTSDIVSYVTRQSLPTISTVTADSLQDLKSASNVVVVGYFAPGDNISYEAFTSVAEAMHEDYVFGVANDDALAKKEQINAISTFVKAAGTPLVAEFHPELHFSYIDTGLPLGYILAETAEERAQLSKTVEPLAKKYKDKVLFGTVDVKIFDSLADDLHLEPDKWPAFAIREPVKGQRFPLNHCQQLSEQVLNTFVKDFIDGKLKPAIKSEPIPETQQGPVTVIVGHTYDDLVINNEKDVLVDYYTQSCAPCKAMAPIYEKLANLYASNPTNSDRVTIAKIDAEANDVPGDIRGFPTFKLFPAGSKESPVLYDGPWTIEDFANFVRDNGKHKIDVLLENNTNDSTILHEEQLIPQRTCVRAVSEIGDCKKEIGPDSTRKEADTPQIAQAEMLGSALADHDEL